MAWIAPKFIVCDGVLEHLDYHNIWSYHIWNSVKNSKWAGARRSCKFLLHIFSILVNESCLNADEGRHIASNLREATTIADLVPTTKVAFDIGHFLCCQEHLVPCLSLLCIHVLNFFFTSIHCLNITTWVMCQRCTELAQQLPHSSPYYCLPLITHPQRRE